MGSSLPQCVYFIAATANEPVILSHQITHNYDINNIAKKNIKIRKKKTWPTNNGASYQHAQKGDNYKGQIFI